MMVTGNDRDDPILSQAKCAGSQRLIHSILDTIRGKTVSLYECHRCGEHIWHE
jgi:hypothetical protein